MVEQNISRLEYLLSLFKMTREELLVLISDGLKKSLTEEDIFAKDIKINHLKRIDSVFNKGLQYYLDPKFPVKSKEASIFFRKIKFDTDLNIGARKTVNHFEELKISLSAISKLAEIKTDRLEFILNSCIKDYFSYLCGIIPPNALRQSKEKCFSTFEFDRLYGFRV